MTLATALKDPTIGTIETPVHELAAGLLLWATGKITKQFKNLQKPTGTTGFNPVVPL